MPAAAFRQDAPAIPLTGEAASPPFTGNLCLQPDRRAGTPTATELQADGIAPPPNGRKPDPRTLSEMENEGARGCRLRQAGRPAGRRLHAPAVLVFDDPLPEPGEAKSKILADTALTQRPVFNRGAGGTEPQAAGIFSGSGRSRRPYQRERTEVPSALRLSIAAMPMNRPPAPPSRFNTIVESTKFFVTP